MTIVRALLAALVAAAAFPANAAHQQSSSVVANDVEGAIKAIATVDPNRLLEDQAYAKQTLAQVEILRGSNRYSGGVRPIVDRVRMFALVGTGQSQEAFAQATELTKSFPGDVGLHFFAFLLGVDTGSDRTLDELELADLSISGEDRIKFRDSLQTEMVGHFRRPFFIAKDKARIARSAQALLNFGWPGPHKLDSMDGLRLDVADGLLEKGDLDGARKLVFSLQSAEPVLQVLIARKWDKVVESGDPSERLAQAIAASDEASQSALRAKPDDVEILLRRAQFLRSVGKDAAALDLILPKANDLAWLKEKGEDGFWVANAAAYALVDVKREKDAVSLMENLLSLGLAENPVLISMAINSISIRVDAGDFRGAADYAEMLATKHADIASAYGRMWMWEGAVCAHSFAGSTDKVLPWLVKLKAGEKDNPAALTRALLCVNDLDGAAASVVKRLDDNGPDDMLKAVQDYSAGPDWPATKKLLDQRFRQVIARPEVQTAIARHGRVMKVPLSRTYWGMF